MRNVNPEWFYGWNLEPTDEEVDLVEDETPITVADLDEPLCNYEGAPADDCRC